MLTETFLRYGQPEPPADLIPLWAGPLTMLYDPTSGMVRRIMFGEVEVIRGIYAAVRDHNWGTVPGKMREIIRKVETQSFQIEFESEHQQGGIHFTWRGIVRGDGDGTLRYEFDGAAKTTFHRNRIGICVLHPIQECAGARARQVRVDGSEIDCRFPDLIEPQIIGQSSFRELRQLTYEIKPNLWAEVEFEGDIFEMEDQRNWTDASFKTYCTPLSLPFPIEVKAGSAIRQTVTLKLVGDAARPSASPLEAGSQRSGCIHVSFPESPTKRLPAIGLGLASQGNALIEAEIISLRKLRLKHLRVDLHMDAKESAATLQRAVHQAAQLNAGLELALHLPLEGEIDPDNLLQVLNQQAAPVLRILALREHEPATSHQTLAWVRRHFGALNVPIGAGSDCNFCELNREHALGRLALQDADFLFWSINPQVHAFDHMSLVETLEAQAATVVSARAFAGSRPLVISPITLKQRFNPVATGAVSATVPGELPSPVDPRQLSHFAAAWTIGSLAALTSAGVDSVTYFETTGWRGMMERPQGSQLPVQFPSAPGETFPLFQVFADVAGYDRVAWPHSPSRTRVTGLGLFSDNQLRHALIANLTPVRQVAMVGRLTKVHSQLELNPYELTRIDL